MQSTDIPDKFAEPFAALQTGTYMRAIPVTSADPVAASLDLGFPAGTFGSVGTPPDGRDFNGLLNQDTAWAWWQAAGGTVPFDSAFSTAVGGYPKGCVLPSTTLGYFWQSTVENNTNNPDVTPTGWIKLAPALPTVGGPGTGFRKSADGFIEQWGTIAIGAGSNIYSTSFSFPTPFTSEVHGPFGNANNVGSFGWYPVVVMFPVTGTPLLNCGLTVDTANSGQHFGSGVYVNWTASGY